VSAGNGTNGSGAGVSPRPEEVRADTEAALQQVLAAGEVAQGMWRFLLADRDRHRVAPVEPGSRRDGGTARAGRPVCPSANRRGPATA
jgi:hypothetical protein